MRPALFVLVAFVLVACRPAQQSEERTPLDELLAEGPPRVPVLVNNGFEISTVRIVFRHQGAERGTSTLWIENFGERAAMLNQVDTGGGPEEQRTYWDGKHSYIQITHDAPVAQSSFEPAEMEASSTVRSSNPQKAALGWVQTEKRTVAGQACQVWRQELNRNELCVWRGLDIQEIVGENPDGSFNTKREAVEIVEGERIPAEFTALAQ
jgi:hypothetical protein